MTGRLSIILLLLCFTFACSDSLTGPGKAPPLLFPLTQGSIWNYAITDYESYEYANYSSSTSKSCSAEIEVLQALNQGQQSEYLLKVHFTVDSVRVYKTDTTPLMPDTAYTLRNVLDTTFTRELVARHNALYWRQDSTLDYFLPLIPSWGSKVNLTFFNFGYFRIWQDEMKYSHQSSPASYLYLYNSYNPINAVFNPDSGGLTSASYNRSEGTTSHKEKNFLLQLVHYTPGN